ncbi:DNA repair protein RecN, partial [Lactobacillus paragasseri]
DLTDPDEDEKLEEEFNELNNYQKIADTANYFMQLYDDDEHGLATLLGDAQNAAEDLSNYGKKFENFATSFNDGVYSLNDARSELSSLMDQMDFDEERYQYVSSRLDTLNTLKKKYGPTLEDVFKFAQKVKNELGKFETGDLDEEKIQKQLADVENKLSRKAKRLHKQREQTARELEEKIKKELADLYMEKARFSIRINETDSFTKLGTDQVIFMIAPNPGESLMPLVKIVSGGEQSRLILALKAIFSRVEPVGTMIFDEIDTGVSGRVSAAIGKKMHAIGQEKQVITITHSPQVAAAGDQRFSVVKQVKDGATYTQVGPLTQEEAITAIAQMMAGSDVTDAAKRNAADLMESFKK